MPRIASQGKLESVQLESSIFLIKPKLARNPAQVS